MIWPARREEDARPVYLAFANARLPDTDYRVAFQRLSTRFRVVLVLPERPTAVPTSGFVRLRVIEGMSVMNVVRMLAIPWILWRRRATWAHFFATQYVTFGPVLARIVGVRPIITITGLGRSFDAPVSWSSRLLEFLYSLSFRVNARLSQIVLFQNESDLERLRTLLPLTVQHKCRLIGSAVDASYFAAQVAEPNRESKVCLMVARLVPAKGIADFLMAAERLSGRLTFLLVGPSSAHHPEVLEEVLAGQRRGLLRYVGQQSDDKVRELYREASLVAFPSRSEGLPRVVLEAALSRRPVVAYAIPACRAVLPADQLIEPFDLEAFISRLENLVADPRLGESAAEEARRGVLERFSVESYTSRLEVLLEDTTTIVIPRDGVQEGSS